MSPETTKIPFLRSLYFKVSILFVSVVLVTAVPLIVITQSQTEEAVEKEIISRIRHESHQIMNGVDRFLYERMAHLKDLAREDIFRSTDRNQEQLLKRLNQVHEDYSLYESLSFFDSSRVRLVDTKGKSVGQQHSFSKYWKKLKNEDMVIDISRSESLGEVVMHFAMHVKDDEGHRVGVIVSRVTIGNLYQVFRDTVMENNYGAGLNIELVDEDGRLLFSNLRPDRVLEKDEKLIALQEQMPQSNSAVSKFFREGEEVVFCSREKGYLDFVGNGWLLVVKVPEELAFQASAKLSRSLVLGAIPLVILMLLAALLIARKFAKPIRQLSQMAENFAQGDLDNDLGLRLKDERKIVAESIQKMAHDLKLRYNEMEGQKVKIEDQANQITSSIRYAQRIQSSLLTNPDAYNSERLGLKVFYKPRDIVGGDFYYVTKVVKEGSEKLVVASVDCTGHGVPGGFMTVIASNLLNYYVMEQKVVCPAELLYLLHKGLERTLHKKERDVKERIEDGMDIGVVVLDMERRTMEFSGANQPCLFLRDGEVKNIKGTKFSLGGHVLPLNRVKEGFGPNFFDKEQISLEEDDRIFMFSDGLVDQFGGEKNKKFGKKRFRHLVADCSDQVFDWQFESLVKEIQEWQGNEAQLDDMLLVGINIKSFAGMQVVDERHSLLEQA